MPELFVTNFNRNFTGVSATAANVLRQQRADYDLRLVGHPLPGCPTPISLRQARALSRTAPPGLPFAIWHVRRNPEMRAAIWARDVLGLPIRVVFTSAAQRRHSLVPRWLISRMDAVIATTDRAATFVPHVRGIVPHGADTDLFTPALDRAAAWTATGYGGTAGVATIGRIRPEKGTDLFVDAMIRALPDLPGVTALVIGRATRDHQKFELTLKDRVQRAGLIDRIRFIGEIPAPELPPLMRALSLVIQLPRYEGYGMAPLEGMASGVPFIGSNAGYYEAFSAQGKTGLIVPPDMAQAASDAAAALLSDPERHAAMSRAARDVAENSFSARNEAAGIAEVYRSLWAG
ncbi:glycosyltransferase family 4 protein [Aestuariivita sp.]|jgi:mannosyltransferase|uniref:glycosyltransferase family 4 protein n=1 Tax=Aestuariivita sp. TaxID=1872407 RepID=UPI002173FCA6|nr:glycosyltransferase family 4 protein [Aestuariivita sp.]MCE8008857.1 glycosyltransferase family 4 protein [Aestuariivita sp.]